MLATDVRLRPLATGGQATVLTFTASEMQPSRVRDRSAVRGVEYAQHFAKQLGRDVQITTLPPVHLQVPKFAREAAMEALGFELTSLRSLLRESMHLGADAPVELQSLVRRARRKSLVHDTAWDQHGNRVRLEQAKADRMWLGSVGSLRSIARHFPSAVTVNAHYFTITAGEQPRPHGALGDPAGLLAASGVIRTPSTSPRATLLGTKDGWSIRTVAPSDMSTLLPGMPDDLRPLESFSRTPAHPERVMTPEATGIVDVAVLDRMIVGIHEGGGAVIPPTGLVLRFPHALPSEALEAARSAVPVRHEIAGVVSLRSAVQGGPMLVRNGAMVDVASALIDEGFVSVETPGAPVPSVFPADADRTRAARIAVGIRGDGTLVIIAAQGRSSRDKDVPINERGATLVDMSALLIEEGAVTGLNLDGGGSVQAFVGSGSVLEGADRRGHPFARYDRPVPTALVFD